MVHSISCQVFFYVSSACSDSQSFGVSLRSSGGAAVGDPALIELVFGDFDDPGDLRGDVNGIGARRIGHSDFDVGPLKILLAASETEAALGHVFARDNVVGKTRTPYGGFVTDLGPGMFAAVVQGHGRFPFAG